MNIVLLVVTGVSLALAGFMSAVAWQMSRTERRRSDARVAALSAAIYEDVAGNDVAPAASLFADRRPSATGRYGVAALVGAFVVALVAGLAMSASRPDSGRSPEGSRSTHSSSPLELIALEHERDGDGLVVRGLVRNPADAAERDGLSAVVLLLDGAGKVLATARSAVPATHLSPGATTPFVVNVTGFTGAGEIDRFRLSFRTDERVQPHIDRRRL